MDNRKEYRGAAARAIRMLLRQISWKPNKDVQHLAKRKARAHLHDNATMNEYNAIIVELLIDEKSLVYYYPFGTRDYYAVSEEKERPWLVIFSSDGIIETAFPPRDIADYLTKRGFVLLGRLKEVLHE